MLVAPPPYALSPCEFRFSALAALAGRAALGGRREVALAMYLVARLAHDALPDREVPQIARAERATHAKQWLATLALPASLRPALIELIDASGREPAGCARCLRAAVSVATESLDKASRAELSVLASALDVS